MKRVLSLVLALVMVLGMIPTFAADKTGGELLLENGFITGKPGDTAAEKIDASAALTRQELAALFAELMGKREEASTYALAADFTDEKEIGAWAYPYVAYAQAFGWMNGKPNLVNGVKQGEKFDPKAPVPQLQLAAALLNALGYTVDTDAKYATAAVDAAALGIVVPAGNLNRGQAFEAMWDAVNTPMKGDTITLGQKLGRLPLDEVAPVVFDKAKLTTNKEVLKADGASQAIITFSLIDAATGLVITSAKDVEVAFTTTFGNFAQSRVAVQNGVATVLLTSEFLTSDRTADIRAVVVESKDAQFIGLNADLRIIMSPNPEQAEAEKLGASMTSAEANQADRVIVYFNKDVTVAQYVNAETGIIDPAKLAVVVRKDATTDATGTAVAVRGIMAVPGNSRALAIMLDVEANPANALIDNTNVFVSFTDRTGTVDVMRTTTFKLTDARVPAMLSVPTPTSLRTIKVVFSEAVDRASATNPANWVIDGFLLTNTMKWGTPTITVGTFDVLKGTDTRNEVTISLGVSTLTGQQVYFTSGNHSVQGSNIGDWAFLTDINNKMTTQTLDFAIPVDNNKPVATVEVQSPEQWLVKYDREVAQTAVEFKSALTLEAYNTTTNAWATDSMNANLEVTKVTIDGTSAFVVETTQDWTVRHNTTGTNKNYFNYTYRLNVAKDAVTNVANGLKSDAQTLSLGGAMLSPDTTSPVISDIVQNTGGSYSVVMSEPVKLPGQNNEGDTLAQTQGSIPVPTADFIKADFSKTITGTVAPTFAATLMGSLDRELTVTPASALDAGEWILVVRTISDDVGNTAASTTKTFTVTGPATTPTTFRVLWAFADVDTDMVIENVDAADGDLNHDYVFIKFSKPVATSGGVANALATTNYTLNGVALPIGTQILGNIAGYDDLDMVIDGVTIRLPQGTLVGKNAPNVINVSASITSSTGEALTNGGEKVLPFAVTAGDLVTFPLELLARVDVNAAVAAAAAAIAGTDATLFFPAYDTAKATVTALPATSYVKVQYLAYLETLRANVTGTANVAPIILTAESTNAITLVLTFSEAVKSLGTATSAQIAAQFGYDADNDGLTADVIATAAVISGNTITLTFPAATFATGTEYDLTYTASATAAHTIVDSSDVALADITLALTDSF